MKQKPTKKCENGVQLRPASIEEAGLFYSELDQKQDEALGTVGHIRMDFGSGGREFWHTWWPHNEDRFNTLEFKEELQAIVDTLRANGPLKDLASMSNYCHKNGGTITEDSRSFGYVAETDHYRYCLRCTPTPGDYQGYLYCYDKRQQEMAQKEFGKRVVVMESGASDLCRWDGSGVHRPTSVSSNYQRRTSTPQYDRIQARNAF